MDSPSGPAPSAASTPHTFDARPGAFAGLEVVEISLDAAGEMAGRLLAQYGANVLKVEPPEGSPTRSIGPFAHGEEDPDHSLTFWYYNTSKRSEVLDPRQTNWHEELDRRLAPADILILSCSPADIDSLGLDPTELAARHPRLVICTITPYGLDGPWSHYQSCDLTNLAGGGVLASCGYDDHSVPPIRPGDNQSFHMAASFGLISILLALIQRDATGKGQLIDLSIHDSVAVSPELANPYYFYSEAVVHRQTCRHAQPVPTQPALFETRDGRWVYFALILADTKPWQSLVEWMDSMDLAADLTDPAYETLDHRQANFSHIQSILEVFFLLQDAQSAYHEGQRRGLPVAVISSPDEVVHDEHLRAREFFEYVGTPDQPGGLYPGAPIRFSAYRSEPQRPAPRLGEAR
ncbi:MAG: CoA transferase [Acidobacteriota bacterium]|nr:CoA transferase [Acidobacteriota bacterium]